KPLLEERQLLREKQQQNEDDKKSQIMSRPLKTICFPFSKFITIRNETLFKIIAGFSRDLIKIVL
ncbi:MAG: hypothetical protein ACE5DL_05125, partial [Nitrosopumilaceae archaeon]